MTRRHHSDHPHGPSQRQLRVGEIVRHVLADIFLRGDLQDKELQGARLTVSEVRVSPDMRQATVYVARLGGGEMGEILKALARAKGFLRAGVGHALTTKFTPDLHFEEDRTFDEAQHIAEILRSKEVAADLQPTAAEPPKFDGRVRDREDEDGTPQ
jgi:ribosome-binding factor A